MTFPASYKVANIIETSVHGSRTSLKEHQLLFSKWDPKWPQIIALFEFSWLLFLQFLEPFLSQKQQESIRSYP